MGDDSHQEGWINCGLHLGDGSAHSSIRERDVLYHEEEQEADEEEYQARRVTQVNTRQMWRKKCCTTGEAWRPEEEDGNISGEYQGSNGDPSEDYIILDDTDMDSDANDDTDDYYIDEAGADIMEYSFDENF